MRFASLLVGLALFCLFAAGCSDDDFGLDLGGDSGVTVDAGDLAVPAPSTDM